MLLFSGCDFIRKTIAFRFRHNRHFCSIIRTMDDDKEKSKEKIVLCLKILRYRKLSGGKLNDVFDIPDPYITVKGRLSNGKKKTFRTLTKWNQPTADLSETFKFVLTEKNYDRPLKIKIKDEDLIVDDDLAKLLVGIDDVKVGETVVKEVILPDKSGDVDIELSKYLQEKPDFRVSGEICEEEKKFCEKRKVKVHAAVEKILGQEFSIDDTPTIGVVGSGGGYRAMIGMSGGLAALRDAGIMDSLMYVSGLSGSAWYICSALSQDGLKPNKLDEFHEVLKGRMEGDPYRDLLDLGVNCSYTKNSLSVKKRLGQPVSFVDFYGFVVGSILLKEGMNLTMSDIRSYLDDGESPYPILTSAHVKDDEPTSKFYAHVENTPHEISFPRYNVNIPTEWFGSYWDDGVMTKLCPEFPLHFYIGSCGCAFAALLDTFLDHGTEENPSFVYLVDELRHHSSLSPAIELATVSRKIGRRLLRRQSTVEEDAKHLIPDRFLEHLSESPFFKNRRSIIDRTAEVLNFAYNYQDIKVVYPLQTGVDFESDFHRELINLMGFRKPQPITNQRQKFSICDAGLVNNVSLECLLRPGRTSELIIVMDMNRYKSDDSFNYMPILQSAEHAWRDGLPFPPINVKELVNLPPKEFLVFESDSDSCPTILWFTLCNKKFKEIKDYKPRSRESVSDLGKPFNDFPVYDSGSKYETYDLQTTKLEFDQLHELMYYNVTLHIDEIKLQISKAIERKRRKIENALMQFGL